MKKFYVLVLVLFILDRLTKVAAVKGHVAFFSPRGDHPFGGVFINDALAFSISAPSIIIVVLVLFVIGLLINVWIKQHKKKSGLIWPLGLIIIGAISNLLDRILYNGVIDWLPLLNLSIINLSDIYISIGTIWIAWHFLVDKRRFDRSADR